jgi:hypothetical protein
MQIIYHAGANCTDGERLLRSLMRSADQLSQAGVALPGPGRYRKIIREAIQALNQNGPAPGTREVLLDAILDNPDSVRLVMSNSTFLCQPARVFEGGVFYGMAAMKLSALTALFPGDAIEVHLGLRNPATFIPAVWAQVRGRSFDAFMGGLDPRAVRWSEVIARMRAAAPEIALTIWCNEDTPLIWDELLHRLSGLAPDVPMPGAHDLLATIMAPEGMARFLGYLGTHPPQSATQLRRVIGAFLDKYALPDAIEEEVDIPGWDAALVEEMTAAYEADVAQIAARPDVTFVAP